jgi:peptidyl-prolyl cis-trans isomerase D
MRGSIGWRAGARFEVDSDMALGFMRRHRRWLYVFLWLVIGAFIVLYIPAFQEAGEGAAGETLGRVGDLTITVGEFQKAYMRQRQVYARLYQGRLDDAMLRNLGLEEQVFDGLVTERLVRLEAERLGLAVDDATLARAITTAPELQRDGRFVGADELRRLLDLQGVSLSEFEEQHRLQLLSEKLQALVTDGVSATPAEAEADFRRRTEQIRAEYVWVDAARFQPELTVSEEETRARFEARKESYRFPERRVVSYLLVDPEPLRTRVTLTETDLQGYYEQHRDEFKEEEQVCAGHILVMVQGSPGGEGHPEAEALKTAEGLLARARAGADFAALAKSSSEDESSAAAGGDLGCFPRGRMVAEFDNAAFGLDPGAISDLVKSPFGYHIIRVQSRRDETIPSLAQVKERIRQSLLAQRVRGLLEESVAEVSAALRRGRSLEEAGRERGLSVQKSAPMARGEAVAPLASPVVASRAFELTPGEVDPEPFPLPRGAWAFIALLEVQPPRVPELKEVQDRVKGDLLEERGLEKARAMAEELRARALAGSLEKAASALGLLRKETPALVGRGQPLGDLPAGRALDDVAYGLSPQELSGPAPVEGGYAVVRVLEKKAFDPAAFEAQKASLLASLRAQKRERLYQAYLGEARRRFAVERRPEVFRRLLG